MSKVIIPDGWNQEGCLAWARGQKQDAVNAVLKELNSQQIKSPRLSLQISYYLFLIGDIKAATFFLHNQLKFTPDNAEVLLNLAVCLSRILRYEEAIVFANKTLQLDPDNYVAHDVLSSCFYQVGRLSDAAISGNKSLEIKNRNVLLAAKKTFAFPNHDSLTYTKQKKRVISFSLWGSHPRYLRGALRNALLAPKIYPGWVCRFYLDDSVPRDLVNSLRDLGSEIINLPPASVGEKLCWRFRIANDQDVGFFVVRDVDSVISEREFHAVQAWIESGKWFHVMRDWWTHTDLILAGMWGGVSNILPDIESLYRGYVSKHLTTPNIDQWFLRDKLWPIVSQSCFIHDRCFTFFEATPFELPPMEGFHIGQNEFAAHPEMQEIALAPYITQLDCLKTRPQ